MCMNKFDLVFTNPPFSIGNKILCNSIEVANEVIALVPISKFRGKNLFKCVINFEKVDSKEFKDAVIGPSLVIGKVSKSYFNNINYKTFYYKLYDERFINFYKLNDKKELQYKIIANSCFKVHFKSIKGENLNNLFMLPWRFLTNGPSKTEEAFDRIFNKYKRFKKESFACFFLKFKNEKCVKHFYDYYYHNRLCVTLLKGLNKLVGQFNTAIPQIDWEKDRDYKNLSYDDLLNILRKEK